MEYDIVRAIRICNGTEGDDACFDEKCPLRGEIYCIQKLLRDAADELERLGYKPTKTEPTEIVEEGNEYGNVI